MEPPDLWMLALLFIFLLISAFFSSSETAFIAVPRARLLHLIQTGHPKGKLVSRLIQRPERLLATILLGNNLINTAAAALGTALVLGLIEHDTLALLVSTVGVTALLLIFGETLPKVIAWNRAERVALAWSRPLVLIQFLLAPGTWVLHGITSLFTRLLRVTPADTSIREEEVRSIIALGAQEGGLEPAEAALLEKVFRFGDRQIRDVLTPRPQMVMLEEGITLEAFYTIYRQQSHTRFPVYQDNTENIVGVLSIKDLLTGQATGEIGPRSSVTQSLQPAYFVPETNSISTVFAEMRESGQGMAIAVDEFGGIAGVATLQQLLGVIVGDLEEDGTAPGKDFYISGNTIVVDASAGVQELNDELSLDLPEGNYQTIAGFVLEQTGDIPAAGEWFVFRHWRITVTEMDGVRIKTLEIRPVDYTNTKVKPAESSQDSL